MFCFSAPSDLAPSPRGAAWLTVYCLAFLANGLIAWLVARACAFLLAGGSRLWAGTPALLRPPLLILKGRVAGRGGGFTGGSLGRAR